MKVFWQEQELTHPQQDLLALFNHAQALCTFRDNTSTQVLKLTADSTQDIYKSFSAALNTMGDKHAPIEKIYNFLQDYKVGDPITYCPGWGSSFVKCQHDQNFANFIDCLYEVNPDISYKINSITSELHFQGKNLYPNPGCWTAAIAITLGMPAKLSPFLIIGARLEAWGYLFQEATK